MFNLKDKILPVSIIVAGFVVAVAYLYANGIPGKTLSSQQVSEKVISYINENVLQGQGVASLLSVADEGSVYKINLKIGEQEYESYATKDGELLFPEGYKLVQDTEEEDLIQTKSDFPDVKLFVMSYCPFGLQSQKMFLPVYNLLKDKADMGVYFVDYIMHGEDEIDENLNQYCIQKEEKDKYSSYLSCFVESGQSADCVAQAGIDNARIQNCISETDQEFNITGLFQDQSSWFGGNYPQFNVNQDLNEKYGIQGSPTIVINDQVVDISPRSPEKFKEVVCQAFNSAPEECSQQLSEEVPSSGIGSGSSTASGSCQ